MGAQEIKKQFNDNLKATLLLATMLITTSAAAPIFTNNDNKNSSDDTEIFFGPKSIEEIAAEKRAEHVKDSLYFADLVKEDIQSNWHVKNATQSWYFAAVLADEEGNIVWGKRIDQQRVPASLTKLMTLYRVLEEIENGNLNWDDDVKISWNAARQFTSNGRMNRYRPKTGEKKSVSYLTEIMMSVSDNTATMALAEHIAGKSQSKIAKDWTAKAKELGMEKTEIVEPTGLKWNISAPKDMLKLTQALLDDFPQHKKWMCIPNHTPDNLRSREKPIENRAIKYIDESTIVTKTGYVRRSKYNIVVSKAFFNNKNYSLIVFGDQKGRPATEALLENLEDLEVKKQFDSRSGEFLPLAVQPLQPLPYTSIKPILLDTSLVKPVQQSYKPKKKKSFLEFLGIK